MAVVQQSGEITASQSNSSVWMGALLITLAFFCVAAMSAFGKAAIGVSVGVLVLFQNGIALLLFAPWTFNQGLAPLKAKHPWLHVLRAVAGLLSQALMFVAVKKIPLVNAVLLSNSAPLFIPLVTWVWLRQKISTVVWISLCIGFLGVIIILHPGVELLRDPAALIATTAALFSAFALVSVNKLSTTDSTKRILFYYFFYSTIASAPFAIASWKPPTPTQWLLLIGIGVAMAASQLLIILAYKHATAARIAPFNYTVVIFSGIFGWIVWKNDPSPISLLGILLISVGGIISTKYGGPDSRGHQGWIGHWNMAFDRPKIPASTGEQAS
jgi:drug/metabolite transporter (DMT)-like permease